MKFIESEILYEDIWWLLWMTVNGRVVSDVNLFLHKMLKLLKNYKNFV